MQIHASCALLPLRRFGPQRLDVPQGARVQVLRGTAWLTVEHNPADQVLATGESTCLGPGERAYLTALGGDALVQVSEVKACRAPASKTLQARLRSGLHSVRDALRPGAQPTGHGAGAY